ncbi:hypothetical protein AGDE_11595 [Angomonas deanei]|uniref:Uncharacterized protein n=1 Tax=Angomonas deanei TaxID=59799 RepID=A0A7G2C9S3_9TRYP|nr:hypothetical protein AGDE_11595 [Angomonas deanei]CAD2216506.1 hypothetical protein, conserved [Angomonas deanei]|eukprot:EPY25991.1 hypothetical protein AGDE_11595 [Angomonas deanei]
MSSKYDNVKLKISVSEDHYYIFSRFSLSKLLSFAKLDPTKAVQVSLTLKKHFVSLNRTTITQSELEAYLRQILVDGGFETPLELFPAIRKFYAERISLIVLIGGEPGVGKSSLTQELSFILNCNNTIDTEVLLCAAGAMGIPTPSPAGATASSFIRGEVVKYQKSGKMLIVEGASVALPDFTDLFSVGKGSTSILLGFYLHYSREVPPEVGGAV